MNESAVSASSRICGDVGYFSPITATIIAVAVAIIWKGPDWIRALRKNDNDGVS